MDSLPALLIGLLVGALIGALGMLLRGARAQAGVAVWKDRAASLEEQLSRLESALAVEREKSLSLTGRLSALDAEKTNLLERLNQEESRILALQERMKLDFENLAARLLEEKSAKFLDQNQQSLAALLGPLRERLVEFRERMETIHNAGEKSAATLGGQLAMLQDLNQRMVQEAGNLATALKGQSKTQGAWGELVLERILEKSGLVKGTEYQTQAGLRDDDGARRMPDVVINLPEERHLIIDAKVSLTAYERAVNAADESTRALALREHAASLRRHVEELSRKDYPSLAALQSPDFVLMFVPVEPALHLALQQDASLYNDAFSKNVVLVSSSTLLVALRAVESVWRRHKQTLNAQEIARQAGKLHDAFVLFVNSLEEVGARLDQARASYDQALARLATGRGNLVRRTRDLEKLGARGEKQIPSAIARLSDDSEDGGTE